MGMGGAGAAMGITGFFPPLASHWIKTIGWRQTYQVFAIFCVGVCFVTTMVFRNKPETYGYLPDGGITETSDSGEELGRVHTMRGDDSWTRAEAVRTLSFWAFSSCAFTTALIGTSYWFYLPDILKEKHVSDKLSNLVYVISAIVSVLGRIFTGWVADYVSEKYLVSLGLAFYSAGFLLCIQLHLNQYLSIFMSFCMAMGSAFVWNINAIVYANHFGRDNLGSITAFVGTLSVLGSALGPFPFGAIKDATNDFDTAFYIGVFMPVFGIVFVLLSGDKPVRESYSPLSGLETGDDNDMILVPSDSDDEPDWDMLDDSIELERIHASESDLEQRALRKAS